MFYVLFGLSQLDKGAQGCQWFPTSENINVFSQYFCKICCLYLTAFCCGNPCSFISISGFTALDIANRGYLVVGKAFMLPKQLYCCRSCKYILSFHRTSGKIIQDF